MTAKFKQIIDQLNALSALKADKSMPDEDFIAGIEAYILLCSLCVDLNVDCSGQRRRRGRLFSEFTRRINAQNEIQFTVPLIRILHDFIYDRGCNHIPVKWKDTYSKHCSAVVESYCKNPLISATDYLFALDTASRKDDDCDNDDIKEYKAVINTLLENIENISPAERIRRIKAYDLSHFLFIADNWEYISVTVILFLKKQEELLDSAELTFAQRYRLENLSETQDDNEKETIERLLADAATSFDIAILFDIDSLGTPAQYAAVMDLYKSMFNKAVAESNTTEIANLLAISAECNSNPTPCKEIEELTSSLSISLSDQLPLPIRRVNEIAATVYTQIDKITGKYDEISDIPA